MSRFSLRTGAAIATLVAALAIAAAPAGAKVVHREEGSFNGSDAPGGAFGPLLMSDAVDQSNGDVYVAESNAFGFGRGVVDKFDENGAYAGVEITGTETLQGSFAFGLSSGVAVDSSAGANKGDLYVADTEHGVVDRFSESGIFECQITGKTPASLEEEENECNGAAGSKPTSGPEGIAPTGLAVDSSGDVYVADDAHAVIDKFGPSGEYISQIADSHLTNEMATIALDSSGNLYVTNFNFFSFGEVANVVKFKPNGEFVSVFASNPTSASGVAVDPATDHVYVAAQIEGQAKIAEYEPSGTLLDVFSQGKGKGNAGLAVDGPSGKIYLTELELEGNGAKVHIFGPGLVVPDTTTGSATNVEETSATLNGHVDPDAAHGGGEVTECQFEYGTTTHYGFTAPCSPAPPYASPEDVSANIGELTRSTTYHFRLEAGNANGPGEPSADETFITPGPPAIDSESSHAKARGATLQAQINPFGFDTTCQLQYVDDASFQSSKYANATTLPCTPEDLGSGFGDQNASVTLEGLKVGTTYHYRFLAANQAGLTGHADKTFATFGPNSFTFETLDEEGNPYTQAGGHPYELRTSFKLSTTELGENSFGQKLTGTVANLKDTQTELPPGLLGNPSATPKCTRADLVLGRCSGATQVGVIHVQDASGGSAQDRGLYNLVPPAGVAAEFGAAFNSGFKTYIDAKTRSGGDYGITAEAPNAPTAFGLTGVTVEMWGVPADSSHDAHRECPVPGDEGNTQSPCSADQPVLRPFLSNPTSCAGPLTATLRVDSWQAPGEFADASAEMPPITGCNKLDFSPGIEARPTTSVADSPSGLHVDLHLPQDEAPCDAGPPVSCGLAEANLKDTVVTLPKGITVNPSAASGLDSCSSAQVALHSADPANCPDAAKIGTVEVDTPLLEHPLPGAVYIAKPFDNPFNSLLAIYVAVNDPESGVVVKLAGHVEANPETGQITTTFEENPQLPFEDFKLDFFKGARGALRTPATCGAYTTTSVLTPWSAPESGPPATLSDPFQITQAPGGGNCPTKEAEEPHKPAFEGGTETPTAGAYSPFVLHLARADGSQQLNGLNVALPPGLVGKLAGLSECPDSALAAAAAKTGTAELASGSCPASSEVGTVTVGAGAGPAPFYVQGAAYLAGPYRGAPLSLAIVTPAVAGPFDLGTVVVRTALQVNPETTQITAVSDEIPHILQGIPLDVRSIALNMNRSKFTLNPTNCEKMAITGAATSVLGQSAPLTNPFQVGGCRRLGFKPKLALSLKGGTKRHDFPALKAVVTYPKKGAYANIAKAQVTLPHSAFLEQGHIKTVCTRPQLASHSCPKASIYGHATAVTPLLDKPLSGPVYLGVGFGHKLPDLVADLNGQIEVLLHGKVDTGREDGLRNTFQVVPDAPVTKFTLELFGGKRGLVVNSENLCGPNAKVKAVADFTAQNGKMLDTEPTVANSCKRKGGKGHRHHKRHQ